MPHLKAPFLFGVLSLAAVVDSRATDLIKADNTTSLNTAGSYTDALATPTNADWVIFNNTFATTTGTVLTGGTTARGLRLVNPGNNVTLSVSNSTFSLGVNGATSSATSGSIDMSSATKDLTINSGASGNLRFYGSLPSINVTSGRTLNISAQVVAYNGGSLKTEGAGAINLNGVVKDTDATHFTSIAHAGPGTLTLAGANTYTGGTIVNAGTLLAGNASGSATGTGTVTVNSTGTFGGSGIVSGATTANSGAFLSAGASSGAVGTLTFGSTLDIAGLAAGTGGLLFDLGITAASDKVALTSGALNIGSGVLNLNDFSFTTLGGYGVGTYTLFDTATSIVGTLGSNLTGTIGGLNGALSISGNDLVLTVTAIPEPSTVGLLAGTLGLGVAMVLRKRRA